MGIMLHSVVWVMQAFYIIKRRTRSYGVLWTLRLLHKPEASTDRTYRIIKMKMLGVHGYYMYKPRV